MRRCRNTRPSTSHVLQDVLARLDKTYQAFFRRVQRGEKAGVPRYQGRDPLALLHLQGVWQRRATGQRLSGPVQDRAHWRPLVAPAGRHAQDRHDLARSRRVVCLHFVCRGARPAACRPLDRKRASTLASRRSLRSPMARAFSRRAATARPSGASKMAQRRVSRRKKGSNRRRKAVCMLAKAHHPSSVMLGVPSERCPPESRARRDRFGRPGHAGGAPSGAKGRGDRSRRRVGGAAGGC